MELLEEKTTLEIANKLYELSKDMDYMDYKDEQEQVLNELEQAIYHIKTLAENKYNEDFRLLYNILQRI